MCLAWFKVHVPGDARTGTFCHNSPGIVCDVGETCSCVNMSSALQKLSNTCLVSSHRSSVMGRKSKEFWHIHARDPDGLIYPGDVPGTHLWGCTIFLQMRLVAVILMCIEVMRLRIISGRKPCRTAARKAVFWVT